MNQNLEALRILVNRQHDHEDLTPNLRLSLLIPLDKFLKSRGYKHDWQRRDFRLYLYASVVQRHITTTNDLSGFEVRTIRNYLWDYNTDSFTKEGNELLVSVEASRKNGDLPYEGASTDYRFQSPLPLPNMQEAPF